MQRVVVHSPGDGDADAAASMVEASHVAGLGGAARMTHVGGCGVTCTITVWTRGATRDSSSIRLAT